MNDRSFQFFLQFHHGIPRQGPGTPEATAARTWTHSSAT
jgi:hypothetical protein